MATVRRTAARPEQLVVVDRAVIGRMVVVRPDLGQVSVRRGGRTVPAIEAAAQLPMALMQTKVTVAGLGHFL